MNTIRVIPVCSTCPAWRESCWSKVWIPDGAPTGPDVRPSHSFCPTCLKIQLEINGIILKPQVKEAA